jgi:ankyrin repeat protein
VNHVAPEYGNALVVASLNDHEALAIALLENHADPNVADGWGFTALHYALREGIAAIGMARTHLPSDRIWIRSNKPELVKALLAHGANPNARVRTGLPPYDYLPFAREDNGQMPYLRQPGATPFLLAAASADIGSMKALAAAGADPLLATDEGATPVTVAAGLGKLDAPTKEEEARALEAVRLAVDLGGDVNAALKDGRTALMAAAHLGANTIIQFLAEKGANLNATDKYGQTALGLAQGRGPEGRARGNRRYFRIGAAGGGNSTSGPGAHKSTADLLLSMGATPLPARAPRGSPEEASTQ